MFRRVRSTNREAKLITRKSFAALTFLTRVRESKAPRLSRQGRDMFPVHTDADGADSHGRSQVEGIWQHPRYALWSPFSTGSNPPRRRVRSKPPIRTCS